MTLQYLLLFGALASVSIIIPIIRFANKTVKIREIWDTSLHTNRSSRIS